VHKLLKKWGIEIAALEQAFDDPFTWNMECAKILETIEKRIKENYDGRSNKVHSSVD
jgi:hypothetical protein